MYMTMTLPSTRYWSRLLLFEHKYGVSSEYFIAEMAAEDLEDGDEEYVQWAGEGQLMQRLQEKLDSLRATEP